MRRNLLPGRGLQWSSSRVKRARQLYNSQTADLDETSLSDPFSDNRTVRRTITKGLFSRNHDIAKFDSD
ncbi:hypothetical protein A0H81_13133 [Grifola frondosa]|uniref:Uncharacterized protein n=1 Tax=Grifola frondosa TaxID=5627 RepID=A0A1C7LRK1_GRIFR|nr:hypothetical protein A0H81_13133 [Grifola frondosa]